MDAETIRETIYGIKDETGLVSGAELNIKYSENEPVDTIDLFTMKYHDFINIKLEKLQSLDFLDVSDAMDKRYNKSKEILQGILSNS